jgi:hypothetical protein
MPGAEASEFKEGIGGVQGLGWRARCPGSLEPE